MKPINRVKEIIEHKRLSVSAFEKETGMSNNSIQIALKRATNLKDATLNSILNTFPEISPEWLLTGKGTMLKECQRTFNEKTSNSIEDAIVHKVEERLLPKLQSQIEELKILINKLSS